MNKRKRGLWINEPTETFYLKPITLSKLTNSHMKDTELKVGADNYTDAYKEDNYHLYGKSG